MGFGRESTHARKIRNLELSNGSDDHGDRSSSVSKSLREALGGKFSSLSFGYVLSRCGNISSMGGSDDEFEHKSREGHDRRGRDKFRGERKDSYRRSEERHGADRRRVEWDEPRSPRAFGGSGDKRYRRPKGSSQNESKTKSPDARDVEWSPAPKRRRTDSWFEDSRRGGCNANYMNSAHGGGYPVPHFPIPYHPQPPFPHGAKNNSRVFGGDGGSKIMLTFKGFLAFQEDSISEEEARTKYNEYKENFEQKKLEEFFSEHKDEEWFQNKYHPEEMVKVKQERLNAIQNRKDVFMKLYNEGRMDEVMLEQANHDKLSHLLDTVVILLEGGNEEDLKVLDPVVPLVEEVEKIKSCPPSQETVIIDLVDDDEPEAESPKCKTAGQQLSSISLHERFSKKAGRSSEMSTELAGVLLPKEEPAEDDGTESDRSSPMVVDEVQSADSTVEQPGSPPLHEMSWEDMLKRYPPRAHHPQSEDEDEPPPPGLEEEMSLVDEYEANDEDEDEEGDGGGESRPEESDGETAQAEPLVEEDCSSQDHMEVKSEEQKEAVVVKPAPRELHRTSSLFLRFIPPSVTKQEVEAMCSKFDGFKRVSLADPNPEIRWLRRGWITFDRSVDIKKICLHLSCTKLRDCHLGTIVNREMSRRIRLSSGINSHKPVARVCFKMAAILVAALDKRAGLWREEGDDVREDSEVPRDLDCISSKNPLMRNIIDFLVEEEPTEEDEWLGQANTSEKSGSGQAGVSLDRDEALLRALDRLLWYLRVVHSIDFYNHCEYLNEDRMPNRCGVMHVRGHSLTTKITASDIASYCEPFEKKIKSLMPQESKPLLPEELQKLGNRDPEKEIEKFIETNSVMLGKEKWLCQLSGKKFKAPEFVKKHIFFKYAEKIEEVRKETEFYNNYLKDSNRPQPHVELTNQKRDPAGLRPTNGPTHMGPGGRFVPGYGRSSGLVVYQQPGMMMGPHFNPIQYRMFRGGFRGRVHSIDTYGRPLVNYRDLDAVPVDEMF